jgi:prephenate dehydratase
MTSLGRNLKIGIQGVRASFHDVAAEKFFSIYEPIECESFKILCEKLKNQDADFCVMAIENTIAGSILTNYSLLETYRFKIVGEVYLKIELCLMALPNKRIEDLSFVQSHPMALLQCEEFFFRHPHLKLIEGTDTAESAKNISIEKKQNFGAVANKLAAKTYGLNILNEGIETNPLNYTRFLIISRSESENLDNKKLAFNKASLRFETPNVPGGLVTILNIFKVHQINMTKIQSVPILGKPYQYSIHCDIEWENENDFLKAKASLIDTAANLIFLGEYVRSRGVM